MKILLAALAFLVVWVYAMSSQFGSQNMRLFIENPCAVKEMRMMLTQDQKIRCAQVDALNSRGSQ